MITLTLSFSRQPRDKQRCVEEHTHTHKVLSTSPFPVGSKFSRGHVSPYSGRDLAGNNGILYLGVKSRKPIHT